MSAPAVPARIVCARCGRSIGIVTLGSHPGQRFCFACSAAIRAAEAESESERRAAGGVPEEARA